MGLFGLIVLWLVVGLIVGLIYTYATIIPAPMKAGIVAIALIVLVLITLAAFGFEDVRIPHLFGH